MTGARAAVPVDCAFILEEGTELASVGRVAEALGAAARGGRRAVVTGDTKVVDAGHGDGVYINTAGIGLVADGVDIRPRRAAPGDVVIVSGDIGGARRRRHELREGLEFGTTIVSDTAPLNGLVAAMLAAPAPTCTCCAIPTRGGLAAVAERDRRAAGVGVEPRRAGDFRSRPRSPTPAGCSAWIRCTWPTRASWSRSCRGRRADAVLAAMRAHPLGGGAAIIGECVAEHPGMVTAAPPSAARGWSTCRSGSSCPGFVECGFGESC